MKPITFADAVKYFRRTHRKSGLKPTTRIGYNIQLDTLLLPRFGTLPLEAIDQQAIALLDAELVDEGLAPEHAGTISYHAAVGVSDGGERGVAISDAGASEAPEERQKGRGSDAPGRPRRHPGGGVANRAVGLSARGFRRPTGRRGARLRWPDVDLEAGRLTIRRSISAGFETTPKWHHQRRIPMSRMLRVALEAARPGKTSHWAPVTSTAFGKPWGENGLTQAFKRAMERAKLTGWSFHDLRHFFVSELFRMGVSAEPIRIMAGHADLGTTQRYADLDANDLRAAVERIDGSAAVTSRSEDPRDS